MSLLSIKRSPLRAIALILASILFYVPVFSQSTAAPEKSFEAPPIQWPRSKDYHVEHYKIELAVDLQAKSINGTTTITLKTFSPDLKEIELDAGEMDIKSVTLASGAPLKFRYEDNQKLYAVLDRQYGAESEIVLAVNYSATPKQGLTFISPTPTDPGRPYQAWSQGEAQTNHYWFPCYDYPNDKSTSETITTVDDKYMVISNGSLVDVHDNPAEKTKTWHWKMDRPYSSYLTSIVVGRYEEVKDQYKSTPVISYVYPGQVQEGKASLGRLAQMVAFFSEKTGIEYPYPKYAEVMVRDFPGGMENISATTMTDTAIHDQRAELDQTSDLLVSHELAHQWFGDMITCRDWGQIWLNESFAEFFADLWDEHHLGESDYKYDMLANQRQYLLAWMNKAERRPVVTTRYSDPDGIFDAYAYPRGAATVNMLRHVLGDEQFFKAIHHYLEKYAWQNVDTPELIDAIAESTGQDLNWFFDEWVYKMGHPAFDVSYKYDQSQGAVTLTVKQTQKPDKDQPWFPEPDFFTMPVDVAITTASGEHDSRIWITKPEQEFAIKVDSKPLIVNFDRGDYVIKQLTFSKTTDELSYQALHDSDVMGRVWAIDQLSLKKDEQSEKALAQVISGENFWGARLEAVRGLTGFHDETGKNALLVALKDKDARVRTQSIKELGSFKDKGLANTYISCIHSDPSYGVVTSAAIALGETGDSSAYSVLTDLMKQDSWQDALRGGAMRGLSMLKDPRILDMAMGYAQPGHAGGLRAASFMAMAQLGRGNDKVLQVLVSALKEPSEQIVFGALQALGQLGDARAIPDIQALEQRSDMPVFIKPFVENIVTAIKSQQPKGT